MSLALAYHPTLPSAGYLQQRACLQPTLQAWNVSRVNQHEDGFRYGSPAAPSCSLLPATKSLPPCTLLAYTYSSGRIGYEYSLSHTLSLPNRLAQPVRYSTVQRPTL